MICHTLSAQVGAIELVVKAVKSGELSQESIQASADRINALKAKYLSTEVPISQSTLAKLEARNLEQAALAAEIYAKSTTVVRSVPGLLPLSSKSINKLVFVSPGKSPAGGGAVESGEEKTREPYTPSSYIDVLRAQHLGITEIRFHENIALTAEEENLISEAEIVIFATRNAILSLYQKDLGLSLGTRLRNRLIVIATCDPYDFLQEEAEIKNYIAVYEPTLPAFKSAVDVIFGIHKPQGSLPVRKSASGYDVRPLTYSDEDIEKVWEMWAVVFPRWPIVLPRFAKLLRQPHGKHWIHDYGFCISFLESGPHGKITAVGVLPEYRGRGLGTFLITKARTELRSLARTRGKGELKSCAIGSVFPRFWCEVPIDFPEESKEFLKHRGLSIPILRSICHPRTLLTLAGYLKSTAPTARDLFRDITGSVVPPETLERVSKLPFTFSPWSADLYKECMTKQRANFKNIGWVEAYERLAAANQHHEVMVAFDPDTKAQVGWTIMCSHTAVISDDFAFLPLMPSKDKTGLIACVGVDEVVRGKGVGLALLVKAMENMRERGIEGVCIDWVVIRGFYERLGFDPCWEYEGFDW